MSTHTLPETPHLALDLDAFERNVAHMAHTIITQGGKQWRPHIKAIRSPALAQLMIKAGATGVTCATVPEAQTMVDAGIHDVLIANQIVTREHLKRLAVLNQTARVIAAIDAPVHLALLSAAAVEAGVCIPVVIEVDVGLKRSGVASANAAVELARAVCACKHLSFCGVMAWEGHTTRIADQALRAVAVHDAVGLLVDAARQCEAAGMPVDIVSCSGTGTYLVSSGIAGVTEIQAGGGVFGDVRYRSEFGIPLLPALRLCATVISRPTARRIVCDAGWKYHGCHPTLSRPLHIPGVLHLAYAAEHLSIDCGQDVIDFEVGDRVQLDVGYADATVFLHREIIAMRHGDIEDVLTLPVHG